MQQGRKKHSARPLRPRSNGAPPGGAPNGPGLRPEPIGELRGELLEKYERLSRKYEALVKKFEDNAAERIGVYRLGWWALRTSASALALVGKRGIILSNNRWHELDHGDGDRDWALLATDEAQRRFASLQRLALDAAGDLLTRKDHASSVARYRRADGDQVIEVRSERIADHLVAVLVHDVTQQARADVELRSAREALHRRHRLEAIGEIASGVAHDLNNALNVMRLRLDLLGRDLEDGARSTHLPALSRIVEDAAARVARVQDLSHRASEERLEPVELRGVIAEALGLARTELEQHSLLKGKHFQLASNIPELPPVRANAAELKHVFVNLVLNARDAMPRGGAIYIEGRRDQDFAVISVADEGTGIPDELLERVFEPFFTTKGEAGTGLGLSMARAAMARVGGSIVARNRPRIGAELVLRFPLDVLRRAATEPPLPPEPPPAPGRSLRVLVVDDDPDCLEVTQAVLEAEGLSVATASSGAEALRRLRDQACDLLLCDIGMPEMSGWQVAQEARLNWPAVPIYMITGWGSEFATADSRPSAVEGVLGKPLDIREIRSLIARIASSPEERSG
jgi:signal transduction histidine kinase/ActR/RegA family two-component response regulator